jgi:hypothetical protein
MCLQCFLIIFTNNSVLITDDLKFQAASLHHSAQYEDIIRTLSFSLELPYVHCECIFVPEVLTSGI